MVDWINYAYSDGTTRNQPLAPKLIDALSFLPEMGLQLNVFSGGQPAAGTSSARVGSTRHDMGHAADVFFVDAETGRQLNWSNPEDLPIFEDIVRRGRQSGLTGFGAGPGYMPEGSMHIGFGTPAVWGADGRGANAPDWLRNAYNGAPVGPTRSQAVADDTMRALGMDPIPRTPQAPAAAAPAPSLLGGTEPMQTAGLLGIPQPEPEPEPQSLMDRLRGGARSGALWENLAVAANSLTLNPSQGPRLSREAGRARRDEEAQKAEADRRRMQAAQFFEAQGRPDLAQAVMAGVIGSDTAFGAQRQDAQTQQASAQTRQQANRTIEYINQLPDSDPRKGPAMLAVQMGQMDQALRILTQQPDAAKPGSTVGKINADYQAGLISAEERDAAIAKATTSGPLVENNVSTGEQGPRLLGTQGLVAVPDPNEPTGWRVEPAPGSPIARERAQEGEKEAERTRQEGITMGVTLENLNMNIAEIENGGVPVTGLFGAIGRAIPGSPQTDFANRNTQITTRAALDEVQNMRDNSPTGGAVGQLTDKEREAIGAAASSLFASSSSQEYLRNARNFRRVMLDLAYGAGNWELDQNGAVKLKPAQRAGSTPQQGNRLRYNPATGQFE